MTREEIIDLYDAGMTQKQISIESGRSLDDIYHIINAVTQKRREDRLNAIRAINRKPEVFQVEYGGRTWYDVTDIFTDRPCICKAPMKEERE